MGVKKVSELVMDLKEMAEVTGVHPHKLSELARRGQIPGFFRLGKRILFSRQRFEEFLADPDGRTRNDCTCSGGTRDNTDA
jgi:excisionase family DNA binding protein